MTSIVRVQYDRGTGRYHPACYRLTERPADVPKRVLAYRATVHHTQGFATLREALPGAAVLADQLGTMLTPDVRKLVVALPAAGPGDMLLMEEAR